MSHFEELGVRTPPYIYLGDSIQPITIGFIAPLFPIVDYITVIMSLLVMQWHDCLSPPLDHIPKEARSGS